MTKSRVIAAGLAAAVVCSICTPGAVAVAATEDRPTAASSSAVRSDIAALRAALPADAAQRLEINLAKWGIEASAWREVLAAADGQCTESTEFSRYLDSILADADPEVMEAVGMAGGFSLAIADAFISEADGSRQTFGPDGEFTNAMTHTFRDLQTFWDIPSADIQLEAMHGTDVFKDLDRATRVLAIMYDVPEAEARPIAENLLDLVNNDPTLRGGAHPLFTLNAIAAGGFEELPPTILIGDGLLQVMDAIGLGDTGPKGILAHEFGHQVQYAKGLIDEGDMTPEETRRSELMADAFSAYFLAHARGQAMNAKRLLSAEKSYFQAGDCATDMPGHHGTPEERLASAAWAADLANAARPQGKILPSVTFAGLFEDELPEILEH